MATSPALAREYDRALADVVLLATRDVVDLWAMTPADALATIDLLVAQTPAIAATYGEIAATLGADLYAEIRSVARVTGRYHALPADPAPPGQVEALARWAVSPLFSEEPDPDLALAYLAGGMERLVRQPFRQSVIRNSGRDRYSIGIVRSTSPGACDFCSGLAGEVLHVSKGGKSDGDHWHRNCKCVASPAF